MTDLSRWDSPAEVSDLDVAFPARGGELTPKFASLPAEFQKSNNPWCQVASRMFFGDYDSDPALRLKAGIDPEAVRRHITCVLGTFDTKHEHKIAGAGYLLSRWFELET